MAEPIANIRKVCEDAVKKIEGLRSGESDPAKLKWYTKAAEWARDVADAAAMPDPAIVAIEKDWAPEVERRMELLNSGNYEPLREEAATNLELLSEKMKEYRKLLNRGEKIVTRVITKGLTQDENVDYNFLSTVGMLRDVGQELIGAISLTDAALVNDGPGWRIMNPEPGKKAKALREKVGNAIGSFSLTTRSSAGAIEIAKKRGIKNKIQLKEGEAYLNDAVDGQDMDELAVAIEGLVNEKKAELPGCEYVEVRVLRMYDKALYAIDGAIRGSGEGVDLQLGVKAIARDGDMNARGDFGTELPVDAQRTHDWIVKIEDAIIAAYEMALESAKEKRITKEKLAGTGLADSITDVSMAPVPAVRTTVEAVYGEHPMAADIKKLARKVETISRNVKGLSPKIKKNIVYAFSRLERRILIDSNRNKINTSKVLTEGGYYVTAQTEGEMPEFRYESVCDVGGFDILGDKNANGRKKTLEELVLEGAADTVGLAEAEFFPEEFANGSGRLEVYEKDGKLFTDGTIVPTGKKPEPRKKHKVLVRPTAGGLAQHETCPGIGHSGEGDRREKAKNYAGGTWLADSGKDMIGEEVASPLITGGFEPFDPYDDEGVRGRKVTLIEKGRLVRLMNNREIALLTGTEPTGSARSTKASRVPLIRMGKQFIENGETSPEEMLGMMGDGYILEMNQTPSVTARRENGHFKINSVTPVIDGRTVYDETTGRPKVYRGAGMMADSLPFWKDDLKAVGNDGITIYFPNCGKGEYGQMQVMLTSQFMPSVLTEVELTPGLRKWEPAVTYRDMKGYAKSLVKEGEA